MKAEGAIMSNVTWNDLKNGTQNDLKKTYKLDAKGMEKAVRTHLQGANAKERRDFYDNFYRRRG
jgi:hypothetical protein